MSELKEIRNTTLCYPESETWYICWDDYRTEIKVYGSILDYQCYETPYTQVDYYDNEEDWSKILSDNGITIS
jgi:hypothetical protein